MPIRVSMPAAFARPADDAVGVLLEEGIGSHLAALATGAAEEIAVDVIGDAGLTRGSSANSGTDDPFAKGSTVFSHRNLLNFVKRKLVVGSIIKLRRARGFMSCNFLSRFKRALVFKVNRNPSSPE